MASAGKKSSSSVRSESARQRGRKSASKATEYAVCVCNEGYRASLELRKLYPVIEDPFAAEHDLIRIVDESGEDYLFPSGYFVRVELPASLEQTLHKIA